MDDAGIAAFAEFARGQNLTQEAAQSMLTTLAPRNGQARAGPGGCDPRSVAC